MKLTYVQGAHADAERHGSRSQFTQWFATRVEAQAFAAAHPPWRDDHGRAEPHTIVTVNVPPRRAGLVDFMNHFAGA